ncbi:MAG: S41 family peptidase [Alistipes sp.]|nr:S41 family peptidase [Alistipes sp.]
MKKYFLYAIFALTPLAVAAQRIPRTATTGDDATLQLEKFNYFYRYLNGSYIDTVDNAALVESAIKDILAHLDPHSSYHSPEEMVEVTESFDGKFSGIGVQINILSDTLHVASVISGGPSEEVGLYPNDRIVDVDGTNIVGMNQSEAVKLLRGPKGTTVNIVVVRPGERDKLNFRIVRDDISLETIDAAYMIRPGIGYMRVNRFAQTTMSEFRDAFKLFDSPEAIILDLRSNGGGLLGQSIEMTNFFLPRGSLVVSTQGRTAPSEDYRAPMQGTFLKGKVIVLIDEFSASASEIVSGALQDWDRAVIVGRRSFGKGLVQRQFPLPDGSAVNITVSKYLTPSGRAIQRPFEKGKGSDYYEEFANRFSSGYRDSLNTEDFQRFTTLRLGKSVYEGGGIYPDYYVEADTSGYSDYYGSLIRKGVIFEQSNLMLDRSRATLLEQYPTVEAFSQGYTVGQQILGELVQLGEKRDVPFVEADFQISKESIADRLRFYLARNLYGETGAYILSNVKDPVVAKALDILMNWDTRASGIATDGI